jgi:hypothetical protein
VDLANNGSAAKFVNQRMVDAQGKSYLHSTGLAKID